VEVLCTTNKCGMEHCHKLAPILSFPGLPPRFIGKEVFEDESALATVKRTAAFQAGYFLIGTQAVRFDVHELVRRGTIGALEIRRLSHAAHIGACDDIGEVVIK